MTDTGSQEKPLEDEVEGTAVAEAPAPEPWTAQRVFEWNSYYDLYVAAFVVLLAFLGSANKIQPVNSGLWSLLHAGRQIAATGAPVVTDTTSMAGDGQRWINIPWLYELTHYGLYEAVASLAPKPDAGPRPSPRCPALASNMVPAPSSRSTPWSGRWRPCCCWGSVGRGRGSGGRPSAWRWRWA